MREQVRVDIQNAVARVALSPHGPSVLTESLCREIEAAIKTLVERDDVALIAIFGTGTDFPGGLDEVPTEILSSLCLTIETLKKPVLVVLHGSVVGSAAELALAAHYRAAQTGAKMGFPHARLGLMPSSGATQRLPRLVGASKALDLLLSGRLVPLASETGGALVDKEFDKQPSEIAGSYGTLLLNSHAKCRPTSDIRTGFSDALDYQKTIETYKSRLADSRETAPLSIVRAVEAAIMLPFQAGLAFEKAAAEDNSATQQSKSLRYAFECEQRAAANTRRTDLPEIDRIAVLGGGSVAVQIVICALDAGLRVNWGAKKPELLRDGVGRVRTTLDAAVKQARISPEKASQCLDALATGESAAMAEGNDIVLRAARGQRGIKPRDTAPVAHCIAGEEPRLAIRFAAPAASTRLVEIVLGDQSDERDATLALALAQKLRKIAIIEHGTKGSLSDLLNNAALRAADALVDLGQSPYAIDAALRDWGMVTPPYEKADELGLESISWHERSGGGQNWSATLLRLGREGRGAGQGFYLYEQNLPPSADATVTARLDERRSARAPLPDDQTVSLIIGAMANAGARALRNKRTENASDIDVVSVLSGMVPRWRGGIMHAVGEIGLLKVVNSMKQLGHPDESFWTPEPIFIELIKNGLDFDTVL